MKVKKAVSIVILSLTLGFLTYISVQSFWADIHYQRAQRLAQEINWQEAALELEKAISISPGNADYHRGIGQIYSDLSRIYGKEEWFNKTITHFQKAYQLNPYDAWAHYYLAWAYSNKKMFEQAMA
ncbi:tetratricopeptide repeat protein, partial [Patescibacteria group bacterium]|nr:tetratricopeptide repeat protein [Patescibacteria group bacterium]